MIKFTLHKVVVRCVYALKYIRYIRRCNKCILNANIHCTMYGKYIQYYTIITNICITYVCMMAYTILVLMTNRTMMRPI